MRPLFLRTIVGALCLTALVAIVVLLTGSFDDTSARIMATTGSIAVYGLLAMPAGLLLERGRVRWLAYLDAGLAGVAFLFVLAVIWLDSGSDTLGKTWGIATIVAAAAAQSAALQVRRRDGEPSSLGRLTAGATATVVLLAALGVAAILGEIGSSAYYRVVGAVAVLDVLLIALLPILRRSATGDAPPVRMRVDGEEVEVRARDFAGAAAEAIRAAERAGRTPRRVERL